MSLFNREEKTSEMTRAEEFKPYSFPGISAETSKEIRLTSVGRVEKSDFRLFNRAGEDSGVDVFEDETEQIEQTEQTELIEEDEKTDEAEKEPDISLIEKEAYNRGLTEGKREATESERKKIAPVLKAFEHAIVELADIKRKLRLTAEKETVNLALAIARKVVCTELTLNRDILGNIVKEAMSRVVERRNIKIRLSPSDMNFLRETGYRSFDFLGNVEGVDFEEDGSVHSGGCVIETSLGEIDGRIEKQFQIIEEALRMELEKKALHSGRKEEGTS